MLFYERKLRDHWGENPFNFHLPGATSKFIETILKTPSPGTEFSKDFSEFSRISVAVLYFKSYLLESKGKIYEKMKIVLTLYVCM